MNRQQLWEESLNFTYRDSKITNMIILELYFNIMRINPKSVSQEKIISFIEFFYMFVKILDQYLSENMDMTISELSDISLASLYFSISYSDDYLVNMSEIIKYTSSNMHIFNNKVLSLIPYTKNICFFEDTHKLWNIYGTKMIHLIMREIVNDIISIEYCKSDKLYDFLFQYKN